MVHNSNPIRTSCSQGDLVFRGCLNGERKLEWNGKEFTQIFYPVALALSSIFLAATIIVYLKRPEIYRPTFGKITLGFLINNLLAYICIILSYIIKFFELAPLNSYLCILIGYSILYTFTSFMIWINTMAISIFVKFGFVTDSSRKLRLSFCLVYAQGVPGLLCLLVAILDQSTCGIPRPAMGEAHCFIGSPWGEAMGSNSFFKTPEFIFFHSILLLLQVMNIFLFLGTTKQLIHHWRGVATIFQGTAKENFILVTKLFFIMGIPWLGEFISQWVTHSQGAGPSFPIRLLLDFLNLFSGIFVFLVLGWRKGKRKDRRSTIRGREDHLSKESDKESTAKELTRQLTMDTTRDFSKESTAIELTKQLTMDTTNDFSKESGRESTAKKITRQLTFDTTKDISKESDTESTAIELTIDKTNDFFMESSKEWPKEETKQLTMESSKGLTRKFAKESTKESTRKVTEQLTTEENVTNP